MRALALVLAFLLALGVVLTFFLPSIGLERPQQVPRVESVSREREQVPSANSPLEQAITPAREPVPAGPPVEELRSRVRALEAEVQELRAALAAAQPALDSPEALRAALRELDPNDSQGTRKRNQRRAELIELFLERFPGEPEAGELLEDLSGLHIGWLGEPAEALVALERFSPQVGLPAWKREALLAHALDFNERPAEAELAYQRMIQAADTPEHERWKARFQAAYLYMRRGEYEEARVRFEQLVSLAGVEPDALVRDTVAGARSQLELIERYARER